MPKSVVSRLFISSLIAALAGGVLLILAVSVALANGVFVFQGTEIVDVRSTGLAGAMLAVAIVGILTLIGAAITGLVSWIGALLNTAQLPGKGWFVGLLLLGIFNFGFLAMIAYVIAGPDSSRTTSLLPASAPATLPAAV